MLGEALALLGTAGACDDALPLTLLLPSGKRAPLPSPHLPPADGGDAGEETAAETSWTVRTRAFSTDEALDFLLALPAEPPQGVVVADTLRGLAEVAKLALELVARGRVLPVLEPSGREWSARWRPVLTDEAVPGGG